MMIGYNIKIIFLLQKHKKLEERQEELDEEEMLLIRGGSPENKLQNELSPPPGNYNFLQ